MKINVVSVQSGWILTKIAERIVASAPEGIEMRLVSSPRAGENNFYVDVTNCYFQHLGGKEVGLFTHVHANEVKEIRPVWYTLDHIIHMSRRSHNLFQDNLSMSMKSDTIHTCKMPGEIPEGFEYKKPTIGIFQRGQYEGKGFSMMMSLAERDVVKDFNWLFVGNGWTQVAEKLHKRTHVIEHGDSDLEWPHEYKSCYDLVDYVLIPSKWEGGPMGMLEAAALGKQIIAARVGWVGSEMPVDESFQPGNDAELAAVLIGLVQTRKRARKIVENLSYKDYAKHVVRCFERIK